MTQLDRVVARLKVNAGARARSAETASAIWLTNQARLTLHSPSVLLQPAMLQFTEADGYDWEKLREEFKLTKGVSPRLLKSWGIQAPSNQLLRDALAIIEKNIPFANEDAARKKLGKKAPALLAWWADLNEAQSHLGYSRPRK